MAIEVFNRFENKYLIDASIYDSLNAGIADYMELDEYNKTHSVYQICNLYYDTSDNRLIRTSLMKPSYKEKLRLRSYGTPCADSKVYVEIKKKFRGLVNKRRSALPLDEAYKFLETGQFPGVCLSGNAPGMEEVSGIRVNTQVLKEISYMLEQYRPEPKVFISYERRAYFGTGSHDLRISFDGNILCRRTDLRLESGAYGENLLPKGKRLMEIKTAQSIPVWLCRLMSELKIYPISFSKYGNEYKRFLAGTNADPQSQNPDCSLLAESTPQSETSGLRISSDGNAA